MPLIRWPGGTFVPNYNWRDGIGPVKQRPPWLEMAWGTIEDNHFGTYEFLDWGRAGRKPSLISASIWAPVP